MPTYILSEMYNVIEKLKLESIKWRNLIRSFTISSKTKEVQTMGSFI